LYLPKQNKTQHNTIAHHTHNPVWKNARMMNIIEREAPLIAALSLSLSLSLSVWPPPHVPICFVVFQQQLTIPDQCLGDLIF
jgi:hypothetical protein